MPRRLRRGNKLFDRSFDFLNAPHDTLDNQGQSDDGAEYPKDIRDKRISVIL